MTIWPAKVITPEWYLKAARVVFEDGVLIVANKRGEELLRLEPAERTQGVGAQWYFTGPEGVVWLVEQDRGCGCGGTSQVASTEAQRALLVLPV